MYVTLAAVRRSARLAGDPGGVPRRGDRRRGPGAVVARPCRSLIRPLLISKVNTALQIVLVAVALLTAGFGLPAPIVLTALIWAVAASTLASGAAYVWKAVRAR